jgi:hypothetical protein
VITAVPLRSAAPSAGAERETTGPLLVPLSPKEKDSDDDSDVRIVSSVGEAPRRPSPVTLGAEAPRDKDDSSSTSTSSSGSSSDGTEQSASPSAPATEKDDIVAEAEEDEEEEPESSSYRVTPEEPRAAAVRLQVPAEAKLIGGKKICFLGLTSGGHERQFLEEAGESFAIPHEEEFFVKLSAAELTTACGDLSLKAFIASRCLARRLDQESREAKEQSVTANTSLQNRVVELEGRLAAEQERTRRLQQEKEEAAKSSKAALKTLRHEVEVLSSAKEDLHAQLVDKEAKLAEAQKEAGELSGTLERYRADHIQSAETLRTDILGLLGQCNLEAPPIPFPQCTVEAFYEWVDACFDLVAMNTKIFGELGAAVGVWTLTYSVCSLVPADRTSSEKTISKGDLRRLTKDNYEWPADADLDVAQLPVLPKNLANNFMNTFFTQRGYRLTLNESARLSDQVCRSHSYSRFEALLEMPLRTCADILLSMCCRLGLGCRIAFTIASGFDSAAPLPCPGSWRRAAGSLCLVFLLSPSAVPKLLQGKRARSPALPAMRLALLKTRRRRPPKKSARTMHRNLQLKSSAPRLLRRLLLSRLLPPKLLLLLTLSLRLCPASPLRPPPPPKRALEQTLRRRRMSRSSRLHCWPSALPSARVLRSLQPTQPLHQLKPLSSPKELRSEARRA